MENLSNKEKVLIYAQLGDAMQLANGLTYQIQEIQKAFADPTKLQEPIKWLNEVTKSILRMKIPIAAGPS
jgi:hypothetical protein